MTRFGTAPIPYFGGKQALAPFIVSLLPAHRLYVEVFGGAAAVLFAKPRSALELYNDIDSGLVAFFRVLRDDEKVARLQRLLDLTPYAREELDDCRRTWDDQTHALDDVERARRWFVVAQSSFAGRTDRNTGWRYTTNGRHNPAHSLRSATARLPLFCARLHDVQIDHRDFPEVIAFCDAPDTLFYADPPYVHDARRSPPRGGSGAGYRHELSLAGHARLRDLLAGCAGKVILSGYDHPLYAEKLTGWERYDTTVACSAAGRTKKSGLQGVGSIYAAGQTRVECVWVKPNSVRMRHLFDVLPIPGESEVPA